MRAWGEGVQGMKGSYNPRIVPVEVHHRTASRRHAVHHAQDLTRNITQGLLAGISVFDQSALNEKARV